MIKAVSQFMVSSKPKDFKEGPGARERLKAWPTAELAEQFLQEQRGRRRPQLLKAVSVAEPERHAAACHVRQGQLLHPARQLRALSGW